MTTEEQYLTMGIGDKLMYFRDCVEDAYNATVGLAVASSESEIINRRCWSNTGDSAWVMNLEMEITTGESLTDVHFQIGMNGDVVRLAQGGIFGWGNVTDESFSESVWLSSIGDDGWLERAAVVSDVS